jgi:hypothetical protein
MKALFTALLLLSLLTTNAMASVFDEPPVAWIKECQNDRIYLKADHITLTDTGISIEVEPNVHVSVHQFYNDSQGIFITAESLPSMVATVYPIVWCRTCKAWRTVTVKGKCVVCGNTP